MTLLGKILVVLNLVFGLCAMMFAGALFKYQTNWKDAHDKIAGQLEVSKNTATQIQAEFDTYKNNQTLEVSAANSAKQLALAEQQNLEAHVQRLQNDLQRTEEQMKTFESMSLIATSEASIRREEAQTQVAINDRLHDTEDSLMREVRDLKDNYFSSDRENQLIKKQYRNLLEDNERLARVIRANGIDPTAQISNDTPPAPLDIPGFVVAVLQGQRKGDIDVEISVGKDDGFEEGHVLHVMRKDGRGKYLGKIQLFFVKSDRSVGKLIESTKNGKIERGDYVTPKI